MLRCAYVGKQDELEYGVPYYGTPEVLVLTIHEAGTNYDALLGNLWLLSLQCSRGPGCRCSYPGT